MNPWPEPSFSIDPIAGNIEDTRNMCPTSPIEQLNDGELANDPPSFTLVSHVRFNGEWMRNR